MKLRPYQRNCRIAIYEWFEEQTGNPLVVMATGTGKSVCIADFIRDVQMAWPNQRIVVAVDVQELIAQNYAKLVTMWPDCSAGIYSAGLGKKQVHHKTIFCGIQSIYKHAYKIQKCDILIVDEAHMISSHSDGMWQTFIKELKEINPDIKIIGFTATEYRMDTGLLHTGAERMFDGICYRYGIKQAIEDGYLCEIVPKSMATKLDVSKVKKSRNDYNEKQLQAAVNVDEITKAAVAEILDYAETRKSVLIFSSGVDHAVAIMNEIQCHGHDCRVVTSDTPDGERARILSDFVSMRCKFVVNNAVLTKGFDAPHIDIIACLRPTKSPVLWLQMLGRGTRPIYAPGVMTEDTAEQRRDAIAASTKPNCLLLDFAGNTKNFGPMDAIEFKDKGESDGMGVPPMKECPECRTIIFAGYRVCPAPGKKPDPKQDPKQPIRLICGFEFPEPELKIEAEAANDAVLSTQVIMTEHLIKEVRYSKHPAKPGKPPTLRIDYFVTALEKYSEWHCPEHTGYPREKCVRFWKLRNEFNLEPPRTVDACLDLTTTLKKPTRIWTVPEGKFTRIVKYDFNPVSDEDLAAHGVNAYDTAPVMTAAQPPAGERLEELDDIPF